MLNFRSLRHPDVYLNHLVGRGILLISIPSSFRKVTVTNRAERDQEQIISIREKSFTCQYLSESPMGRKLNGPRLKRIEAVRA